MKRKRSLVSREQMPQKWLNTPDGHDWCLRRATAFSVMAASHEAHVREKSQK